MIMRGDEPPATCGEGSQIQRVANDLGGGHERGDLLLAVLTR